MENTHLKEHVDLSRHLFNHATNHAERFLDFLREHQWQKGLLIELECHRGHSIDYFRTQQILCFGIHSDVEWNERARKLYPRSEYRLGSIPSLDIGDNISSAIFTINKRDCKCEETISEALRILKPGGYLFIHFYLDNLCTDEEDAIRPLLSGFEVLKELKFHSLRYRPHMKYNYVFEVICRKK